MSLIPNALRLRSIRSSASISKSTFSTSAAHARQSRTESSAPHARRHESANKKSHSASPPNSPSSETGSQQSTERIIRRLTPLEVGQSNNRGRRNEQHFHGHYYHQRYRFPYKNWFASKEHKQYLINRLKVIQQYRQQYQQRQPHPNEWDNNWWYPWVSHMLDKRKSAAKGFTMGIIVSAIGIWLYSVKSSHSNQWSDFKRDIAQIKSAFLNPAPSKTASSLATDSLAAVSVLSPSTNLPGDRKGPVQMLTPEQVELRLGHHQRSYKLSDQGTGSSGGAGQDVVLGYSISQLSSNYPVEDDYSRHIVRNTKGEAEGMFFGIYNGHSGWCCSQKVAQELAPSVARELNLVKDRGSTQAVVEAIEKGFVKLDHKIVHEAVLKVLDNPSRPLACSALLPALSGSCALMAYVDPKEKSLYVACAGNSRAVLGVKQKKADGGHTWKAVPLSLDQTGRSHREVKRLQSEHPGEEETVTIRGRVLGGPETTRAFGNARYKWSKEVQSQVFALFPSHLQPNPLLRTPPYITAKPVVQHHDINSEDKFLIMATGGLWDQLTSEEAVYLVGSLLDGKVGQEQLDSDRRKALQFKLRVKSTATAIGTTGLSSLSQPSIENGEDDDELIFAGLASKCPVDRPLIFTYKDQANASTHLLRNAIGGAEDDKVAATLVIPSPMSRVYRDDITVMVILLGKQDATLALSSAVPSNGFKEISLSERARHF